MKLITLDQLTDKALFFNFCKEASVETSQPASSNMWRDDWEQCNFTLPYLLFKEKRFLKPSGEFFLLEDNEKIIGCSGIYTSDFSKDIAIAGCRSWIAKDYRNLSLPREWLLPAQKAWALTNQFKIVALTFNDYNKNIIKTWTRIRLGERRSLREPRHMFYENFNAVDFPVLVQHTKQWAIYELFDANFEYDWNSIKWK